VENEDEWKLKMKRKKGRRTELEKKESSMVNLRWHARRLFAEVEDVLRWMACMLREIA
jgi:hypothetical protein